MAFLDFFTGIDSEEEQARQDKLDAALRAENEKDRAKYGEDWFAQASAHVDQGAIPDVAGEVDDAFWDGWQDGADNIRNGIGSTINTVTGSAFSVIPWQVWLAGAAYIAWQMGAFKGLLAKVK